MKFVREAWKYNKAFTILFCLNVVLFVGDFFTTWLNRDILGHVELNPLYALTGSLLLPVLLNFFIGWLMWRSYLRVETKGAGRFLIISVLVVLALLRLYAIYNAVSWLDVPSETRVVQAQAITYEERQASLAAVVVMYLMPLLITLVSFHLWKWDHYIKRKDEQYNDSE